MSKVGVVPGVKMLAQSSSMNEAIYDEFGGSSGRDWMPKVV